MQPNIVFVVVLSLMIPLGQCVAILTIGPIEPPPPSDAAKMARYILRNSAWVSVATISTQNTIKTYPFVSLKSVSDGPPENSTGVPYLYMTDMDLSGKDLKADNRSTLMATLAQSDYCEQENFDPQDPRCAKLMLSGRILKLEKNTPEYEFGKNALFSKHPKMDSWPKDHKFYVAKLDIEQIQVLDFFGGIKDVTLEDYFNANTVFMANVIVFDIND